MLFFCLTVLMPEQIQITTADEVTIQAEVFGPANKLVLIINPAIGVKRKMYRAFAEYLATQGICCVLYNYRGMEDKPPSLSPAVQQDAETWGRFDQAAVIDWVNSELAAQKTFLLGHSIGGQLLGFADNHDLVDGMVHIASQKGDWRLWPMPGRLKLMLLWYVLIPLMSRGTSFNASRLGLGSYPWPAAAARQWAAWGRKKDYLFHPQFGFDLHPWHQFNKPLLSLGFTDDPMAPPAAIAGLLDEYGREHDQEHIDKRSINPENYQLKSVGHFGFFKPEAKTIWQDVTTWIQTQTKLQTKKHP